jgi:hypothetical protein
MRGVTFSSMIDWEACSSKCREEGDETRYYGLEARRRVSLGIKVTAFGEEVSLHVDY